MRKTMRRGTRRTSPLFILIIVAAFVLSIIGVQVIPIPKEFKQLVFFLAVPLLSGIGVFLSVKIQKRRR